MITFDFIRTFARFSIVGLSVMAVFMGMNAVLAPVVGKQWAFLISYPPTLAMHFLLNKYWTFGSNRKDKARQVSEYVVMVIITFAIQWSVFTLLTTYTSIPSWVAAGAANVAQMVISFLMMQRRVFKIVK